MRKALNCLTFHIFYISQIFQGLLAVFYNLGDGDFNLTMLSHRLDNGEWHEVHLERHDNEMTLRVDGGGGRREVTGSPGHSREIIIDPSLVMLGNSFPTGHNKSFQGKKYMNIKNIYIMLGEKTVLSIYDCVVLPNCI